MSKRGLALLLVLVFFSLSLSGCYYFGAKKEMKNPKAVTMKNKKPATQGVCPSCGTKMFRIGKK